MKKITIGLDKTSVRHAINDLKQYERSMLRKNDLFVRRLGELGSTVAKQLIAAADGDASKRYHIEVVPRSFGEYSQATIKLDGEDILFIEFGSGIHYNPTDVEHAKMFGYGIGTYPGQKHAFDPDGWWYRDSTGVSQHSYGTRATAPMLNASRTIIMEVRRIAREVYGSN